MIDGAYGVIVHCPLGGVGGGTDAVDMAQLRHRPTTRPSTWVELLPGLALVGAALLVAYGLAAAWGPVSPLILAVVLGAVLANTVGVPVRCRPGTAFAAKRLLRVGVVLLGFRLALGDVLRLGGPGLLVVVAVVTLTFFGTYWLGQRLGLSRGMSLLTATGFSICGASAVAAMRSVVDAEEEEVAFAVALVTLCGSLAIVVLPVLGGALGMSPEAFGQWVGASVHDVAQVVATASTEGSAALAAAVVVKLTRVVLLAPMVAGVGLVARRRSEGTEGARPPLLPIFIVGFLAASVARTSGTVPVWALSAIKEVETLVLAAALFGLGAGVDVVRLRKVGGRALALGLLSWLLVALTSYAGVMLVT